MIAIDAARPRGIVWLASYPKSGNTWLRMFLYQIQRLTRGLPREADEINRLDDATQWEAKFYREFEQFLGKPLTSSTEAEISRVRPRVHATIANAAADIVMLKTHNALGKVFGVPTIDPASSVGAIYVVRDPRDVVVSLASQEDGNTERIAARLNMPTAGTSRIPQRASEFWSSWSNNVESWTAGADDSLLTIRYEDMKAKPMDMFSKVVAHLRQTATADQIAEAIELSSFGELKKQEASFGYHDGHGGSAQFFRRGEAGTWRGKLPPAQVAAIISANARMMKKFGYVD